MICPLDGLEYSLEGSRWFRQFLMVSITRIADKATKGLSGLETMKGQRVSE
jgi:hypothetical protein